MPDTGTFVLLGGQASVKAASLFTAKLALASSTEISCWQGVADNASFLWMISGPRRDSTRVSALAAEYKIINPETRPLLKLQQWDARSGSDYSVANFVLRVIAPSSIDRLLPQIKTQMDNVWEQPGCQQCALYQISGLPTHLLGVTYWMDLNTFEAYKNWASAHSWRDVIGPNTLDVPLRMLTRKTNWLEAD